MNSLVFGELHNFLVLLILSDLLKSFHSDVISRTKSSIAIVARLHNHPIGAISIQVYNTFVLPTTRSCEYSARLDKLLD